MIEVRRLSKHDDLKVAIDDLTFSDRPGSVTESNLAWKDTVLLQTGQTVGILLEVTNPGAWMAHCHLAEHHEGA
jgi:FtsP/CotA-like multicopper oxidase with cupredoxin domain